MVKHIGFSFILIFLLFFLPFLWAEPAKIVPPASEPPASGEPAAPAEPSPQSKIDAGSMLNVLAGGQLRQMDMETYLMGVVRAEMPASFEEEALKAQAVAARTYTLYKLQTGGNHGDTADICTDSTCCQAYIGEEQARANWGENANVYEAKIQQAVRETDGETVLYGGVPILAVFHASSAGLTRAAGEVWLNDLPYLQAVESPEQGDSIPNYYSRVEFGKEDLREKLAAVWPEADLDGGMSEWLRDPKTDSAGSVATLSVGGVTVKGSQLRSVLGLRSACFSWEVQDGTMVFFVTGHGHGVGLSQYGANQMAADGADYREILTHYYTGVTVEPYTKAALK